MLFQLAAVLGALLFVSELALAVSRRSARTGATAAAGGSHRLLWVIILVALAAAWLCRANGVGPRLARHQTALLAAVAAALFLGGSVLRWWAIRRLGRFFTVDVATAADQRVVDDGPYGWVRHPSYTGLLMQFAGLALTLNNLVGWLLLMGPVTAALLVRISREETVLRTALGQPYADYCAKTRRLIPGVY